MEALRFIQRIDSNTITQDDLLKYQGQQVEVIILPVQSENIETPVINQYKGTLKRGLDGVEYQQTLRNEWPINQ